MFTCFILPTLPPAFRILSLPSCTGTKRYSSPICFTPDVQTARSPVQAEPLDVAFMTTSDKTGWPAGVSHEQSWSVTAETVTLMWTVVQQSSRQWVLCWHSNAHTFFFPQIKTNIPVSASCITAQTTVSSKFVIKHKTYKLERMLNVRLDLAKILTFMTNCWIKLNLQFQSLASNKHYFLKIGQ